MLLRFDQVSLRFGDQVILAAADLVIEPGERACLIGRNGAGKTSLFRLISGQLPPDEGEMQARAGLRVSQLEQDLPDALDITVREAVMAGLADVCASWTRTSAWPTKRTTRARWRSSRPCTGASTRSTAGTSSAPWTRC
jgi:ATPase subunit of ABC transporter with duplicated ATPase domains